jgi:hypothetical protein
MTLWYSRRRTVRDASCVRVDHSSYAARQTILHRRYKLHRSIIVTSNGAVQDRGKLLGDNTMGSTIPDRLMHRSTKLDFDEGVTDTKRPPRASRATRPTTHSRNVLPGGICLAKGGGI